VPVPVIFDTDIWSDIDDALALAMLHALEDRGEVKLLAVTISTNDRWCASYTDLVNTFYGRPQVPIGMVRGGMDVESIIKRLPEWFMPVTRYTQALSEQKRDDGTWVYPHRLTADSTVLDATTLLRETLARESDGSVVIVEVGYSTNLARLLASTPDAISPLDGRELVARKVRLLVIMAGSFRQTPKQDPEFNLVVDIPAAQALFANWPTPIVASGLEVGLAMRYPPESVLNDFGYVQDHPIAHTYRLVCEERKAKQPSITCPHAHATFDLTAVLYAARPDRNYFSLSSPGRISVLDDGSSHFEEASGGRHQYLILSEEQKGRTLEAMVMLTSQPPRVSR
jgi:purine nucleosidase